METQGRSSVGMPVGTPVGTVVDAQLGSPGSSPGPGRLGYWLGLGLVVAGIAILVMQLVAMSGRVSKMQRALMPGTAKVVLAAGETPFYGEIESVIDGRAVSFAAPTYECEITGTGPGLTMERSSITSSYTLGGYSGFSAFVVLGATAGEYELTCTGDPFVLAWGIALGDGLFAAVGLFMFTFLLGVGLILVTWMRHRKQRRAAWAARHAGPPGPHGPPGPPGPHVHPAP